MRLRRTWFGDDSRHVRRQVEAAGAGLDCNLPGADGAEQDLGGGLGDEVAGGGRQTRVVEYPPEEAVAGAASAEGSQELVGHRSVEVFAAEAHAARRTGAAQLSHGLDGYQTRHGLAGLDDHHLLALGHALQKLGEMHLGGMDVDSDRGWLRMG